MHDQTVHAAMKRCFQEAKANRQMSAERVADVLGVNVWRLYKWLETGRLPISYIPAFERACGAHYVTEALAKANHAVVADFPAGRRPSAAEFHAVQVKLLAATGALVDLEMGKASAEEADEAIWAALQALSSQMLNVKSMADPQQSLPL
ncbi:hypothetical protein HNP46_006113 [Pseudomonas nitritireducens]|uniref:Uncharacterized protein n=1 Tax=Pseudomonas nitroreducens TaxID=46680 RepID=A0A7W7P5D5_PSENT|nr:hypothetical protein [Pseudomonas nitritireducens]MBB4867202.1 hypothetical protein [Pseudomonas nitritireducens]